MNLRDLRYLIALAKYQHFGQAAKACFVSQPTLSIQIKKLEEQLGLILFERQGHQVVLTQEGQMILNQAQVIIRETDQLLALAKSVQDPLTGPLKIGVIPTVGPYLLPHILESLKQHLPNIQLSFHENQTHHITKELLMGDLDALIMAPPNDDPHIKSMPLFKEPFYLAYPKGHRFEKKDYFDLNDLKHENLLLLQEGHCFRDQALAVCHLQANNLNHAFEANSLELLYELVVAGYGITFLPHFLVMAKQHDSRIHITPLPQNNATRHIDLFYRKTSVKKQALEKIALIIQKSCMPLLLKS